jgi:hypothetical protein
MCAGLSPVATGLAPSDSLAAPPSGSRTRGRCGTTGATLDACAHVLRDAGAKEVRALTLAIAIHNDKHS